MLYVGRTKVPNPKVSETFIDDVLIKFRSHGLEKSRSTASSILADCQQLKQQANAQHLFSNARRDSMVSFLVVEKNILQKTIVNFMQ